MEILSGAGGWQPAGLTEGDRPPTTSLAAGAPPPLRGPPPRAGEDYACPIRFAGYAAIFGRSDRGGDVIRRGAFARSLGAVRNVPLLWQHDRTRVVGTIELLGEDSRGLRVIGRLADGALLRRAGGLSFGYRVRAGRETGRGRRELTELDLVEVSLVAVPMQPLARVHAVAD